jgi:phage recombination protein Bet
MNAVVQVAPATKPSLVQSFASRLGVEPEKLLATLKATAFKQPNGEEITNEQMMALLVVSNEYGLNPFTKEIYAFPDKKNGIVPVVGVDGWNRIANDHAQFDGIEFKYADEMVAMDGAKAKAPAWCEVTVYRKDRSKPTVVREYLDEVYRPPFVGQKREGGTYKVDGPWQSHPKRMLRHKTMIQGYRAAFGFGGIFDEDEAQRIVEREVRGEVVEIKPDAAPNAKTNAIKDALRSKAAPPPTDEEMQRAAANDAAGAQKPTVEEIVAMIERAETEEAITEAVSLATGLPLDERERVKEAAQDKATSAKPRRGKK